jgi:hypothetical protein
MNYENAVRLTAQRESHSLEVDLRDAKATGLLVLTESNCSVFVALLSTDVKRLCEKRYNYERRTAKYSPCKRYDEWNILYA